MAAEQMTPRDQFAAHAMAALITSRNAADYERDNIAVVAYNFADAMMQARDSEEFVVVEGKAGA